MNQVTDESLMLGVQDGEVEKIGILFDRYHGMLFNFLLRLTCDRHLSEDLVQEVFVRLLKYRHTFRGDCRFSTWMFQIARNARIDYLRKYSREETLDEEEAAEELVSPDPTPGEQVEQTQELRYVRKALKRLSMDKREVLLLARFHDLRYEEIAGIMNCSVATVKTRVFRAMQDLRENFNQLTGEKTL